MLAESDGFEAFLRQEQSNALQQLARWQIRLHGGNISETEIRSGQLRIVESREAVLGPSTNELWPSLAAGQDGYDSESS